MTLKITKNLSQMCLKAEEIQKDPNKLWIPSQEQLQEIIGDYHKNLQILYVVLNNIKIYNRFKSFNSFEELWLAILMYEKYQKIWDGEEWIQY